MRTDSVAITHENAIVGVVEDALLEQQYSIVEIVDLPLLNPEQLVALRNGIHQHLLSLHKVLEHQRIRWRRSRVRCMRWQKVRICRICVVGWIGGTHMDIGSGEWMEMWTLRSGVGI